MTLTYFALEQCRQRFTPLPYSLACTTAWPYSPARVPPGRHPPRCGDVDAYARVFLQAALAP